MTALVTKHLPLVADAPDGIKKLRAFILELAVRGRLVPQDSSDEPSLEILTRAELALTGRDVKRKTKGLLPEAEDADQPYEVPKGWTWSRLGNIAEVIRGVTYSKSDAHEQPGPNLIPLLRGNNISDGKLNFDGPVFVPSSLVSADQYIRAGDLVIAMSSGSADLVGKSAQAEQDCHGAFGAFCGVVRPAISDFFPYFGFFFQTPFYRSNAAGRGKGIGINNLQKTALQLLYVPVPPLAEQHRIVAKVDELTAMCDHLKAQLSEARQQHGQLAKVLVEQAVA